MFLISSGERRPNWISSIVLRGALECAKYRFAILSVVVDGAIRDAKKKQKSCEKKRKEKKVKRLSAGQRMQLRSRVVRPRRDRCQIFRDIEFYESAATTR